ncbi:MAG: type II toxin-antitoxin system RelB/DinJ family antitoxin [Candidatus Omnitrophica bacterium]|nr:type II toxin-antitoxin system RelB/DinJ family antitoxin [Candidatus Omnitrophota bacterium]
MKTILNIKVDKEEKEKAKQIAMEMGVPLSTIINAHLREFIRTREFSVSLEPRLKPKVEKELLKISKEWHDGKMENFIVAQSAEEAIKLLNKK